MTKQVYIIKEENYSALQNQINKWIKSNSKNYHLLDVKFTSNIKEMYGSDAIFASYCAMIIYQEKSNTERDIYMKNGELSSL